MASRALVYPALACLVALAVGGCSGVLPPKEGISVLDAAEPTAGQSEPAGGDQPPDVLAHDDPPGVADAAPSPPTTTDLVIPYQVQVRSPDPELVDAAAVIEAILEDPRGWQQADIDFQRRDDAPYVIAVGEGADVQQLCQPYDVGGQFSCQNGPLVALNAIRWRESVDHWPGDLASYRTMLVNHEVGHLLGMHHLRCAGPGQVAPVMEQQSGTLRGCQANAWPTPVEIRLAGTHQFRLAPPPIDVPFPP